MGWFWWQRLPHTIPYGNFNFLRSTDKIQFFDEISTSGNIYQFNEGHKICMCITHIWCPTLFPKGIIIFQEVLIKLIFSMKFPVLKKFVDLMKDLKYEHQSIFP